MTDLRTDLGEAVGAAFAGAGLAASYGRVTPSDRPDLADFQCNGALAAAKAAGRRPRDIAEDVAARLEGDGRLQAVSLAGPGFINLTVSNAALSARARAIAADPRLGASAVSAKRRVLVDYGGPNVAKEMHVGHLRASIIGESVKRLYRFRGDEVVGDALFGVWGFQMGLLISAVLDLDPALADLVGRYEADPGAATEASLLARIADTVSLEDLDRIYPAASERSKSDLAYRERARKATAELQAGRAGYRLLWKHFAAAWSRAALESATFHALGVDFDVWKGESDVNDLIEPMVAELRAKGLMFPDQGAEIIRVARNDDKRDLPPLLVVSSEGSAMYGTTDLATIIDRGRYFGPEHVLYVVDQRQADHFEVVFRAAYLAGYAAEGGLEHIGFGTMNGPDGKPFKTRAGGVLKLRDLIEMTSAKARERLHEAGLGAELTPEAFEDTALKVAVAALKFADLVNFRGTSYVFDLDRFSSFEGKTGPYLLYQAVRVKSLLRRAADAGIEPGPIDVAEPAERELTLALDAFDHALAEAYDKKAPHFIAEHAYRLAGAFSKFYAACPILTGPADVRPSRLGLATASLAQLELALNLLGIATPERM